MDPITEGALVLLRKDGRLSFTELARMLGTTRASIAARLTPMLESDELRIVAAVHPRLLGLNVMAHLAVKLSGDLERVVDVIAEQLPAVFISEIVGPEQLIVEVHTRTLGDLQGVLRRIRSIEGVSDVRYLIYQQVLNSFFLGAEPEGPYADLDASDSTIIEMLQHDGRATYAALAASAGLSITAVRARVRRLLASGVMRIGALGQRSDSAGSLVFGLGLNLGGEGVEAVHRISGRRGLEFMARTIGRYDLIATVPFTSLQDFNTFIAELRRTAEVENVSSWLHARIRQERYQLASIRRG
ncbi:Lrp/AsnC family transcriptional regulator [uncultured Arthrobacter sp.]|uniref:Lrp/AsnC family transcriptional regulator n=1 Tax=uncultured Arthrobacter sp. TaxID=114050 RepID=UPI00261CED3D|nr:Lrp/AsnC family transcriptional regulator [uncultured Arthrobacter sp.]